MIWIVFTYLISLLLVIILSEYIICNDSEYTSYEKSTLRENTYFLSTVPIFNTYLALRIIYLFIKVRWQN